MKLHLRVHIESTQLNTKSGYQKIKKEKKYYKKKTNPSKKQNMDRQTYRQKTNKSTIEITSIL